MALSARLWLLAAALLLEARLGYPDRLYRAIGHPVGWIGALIARLDCGLNRGGATARRAGGIATAGAIVLASTAAARAVQRLGPVATVLAAATLLAQRSLVDHVGDVARAGTPGAARTAVARIVGRDVSALDRAAICRAAIESLAENLSDGVVAPAVWFAIAGLPGLAAYKAVNTADSMIGHRTERHLAFGWASARLDDLLNLPAARLTALLIAIASPDPRASARAALRDAGRHRSPNAGWPEAAMAGALGLRLGGPRLYAGNPVDGAWLGDGRADANPADIARAIRIGWRAFAVGTALAALAALALSRTRRATPPSS